MREMQVERIARRPLVMEPRLREKRLWRGLASFAGPAFFWALSLWLLPCAPVWGAVLLGLANGGIISLLFIVAHDAAHGILVPGRRLNALLGRVCLLPALHNYTAWRHHHNGLHHSFTNIRGRDNAYPPWSPEEYAAASLLARWVYRFKRSLCGLWLLYFHDMWLRWDVFPCAERAPKRRVAFQMDRLLVLGFVIAWVTVLVWRTKVSGGSPVVAVWSGFVLPQLVWNWLGAFVVLQQHTHPEIPWYTWEERAGSSAKAAHQAASSPHLVFHLGSQFLMRNVMEHAAHHIDPQIPHYRLAEAQDLAEREASLRILRVRWTPAVFLRTLRVCRLYDYREHRWTDYDGRPLTESLVGAVPVERALHDAPVAS